MKEHWNSKTEGISMTSGGKLAKLRKENHYTQEQMRELLIHKANAACLLGLNEQNRQIMYNKLRKLKRA